MKRLTKFVRYHLGPTLLARYSRLFLTYFLYIKPNLTRQLQPLQARVSASDRHPRILLPLLETNHYQYYQMLALAKALVLRGAEIRVLLCGSRLNGCEIKSIRSSKINPCLVCRFNHEKVVPIFGLDTVKIADYISDEEIKTIRERANRIALDYPKKYEYKGIDIISMTTDSVVRYFYGAIPPEGYPELRDIRSQHLETAMIGVDVAQAIYSEWRPDSLLNNMPVYSAWEPYVRVFDQKSIKTYVVSVSALNLTTVVLNRNDLYGDNRRYARWLDKRGGTVLDAGEKRELTRFMAERVDGSSPIFKMYEIFVESNEGIKSLGIDQNKRNVFLFSNLYWDIGMTESASLYNGVIPWVLDTIEMLKDQPGCHLYIKPHPVEMAGITGSLKGVIDFIRERFPILPSNVSIIAPELKIKTYDLFPWIDVGVVYNGTLGLEMLQYDIPVIVAGQAPYRSLKSVSSPHSVPEYRNALIGETQAPSLDQSEIELFSYFYFIKSAIPWTLTKQAFGDNFKGFAFESLDELLPGRDPSLDHLCNCILDPENTVIEGWS